MSIIKATTLDTVSSGLSKKTQPDNQVDINPSTECSCLDAHTYIHIQSTHIAHPSIRRTQLIANEIGNMFSSSMRGISSSRSSSSMSIIRQLCQTCLTLSSIQWICASRVKRRRDVSSVPDSTRYILCDLFAYDGIAYMV